MSIELKYAMARDTRLLILKMANGVHKGHIGSALSVVELVQAALDQVRGLGETRMDRDRFVLSKGHAAMALYASLNLRGVLTDLELNTYCQNGSCIATHPMSSVRGIDFSTGSLGQGITFAVGSALASKIRNTDGRVFCILSDSEIDEGSTWEAALFAAHHRLENLTVMLDLNGQQALGRTDEVLRISEVGSAWSSLGWDVTYVDGHNLEEISGAIGRAQSVAKPHLIVGKTTAGKGVPFMESKVEWHYFPMSEDQYQSACISVKDGIV